MLKSLKIIIRSQFYHSSQKFLKGLSTTNCTNILKRANLCLHASLDIGKYHSTSSAVVHLTDIVRKRMDMRQLTGALLVDLWTSKVSHYCIENTELKWIQDYLSNRYQIVSFKGEESREEHI